MNAAYLWYSVNFTRQFNFINKFNVCTPFTIFRPSSWTWRLREQSCARNNGNVFIQLSNRCKTIWHGYAILQTENVCSYSDCNAYHNRQLWKVISKTNCHFGTFSRMQSKTSDACAFNSCNLIINRITFGVIRRCFSLAIDVCMSIWNNNLSSFLMHVIFELVYLYVAWDSVHGLSFCSVLGQLIENIIIFWLTISVWLMANFILRYSFETNWNSECKCEWIH